MRAFSLHGSVNQLPCQIEESERSFPLHASEMLSGSMELELGAYEVVPSVSRLPNKQDSLK